VSDDTVKLDPVAFARNGFYPPMLVYSSQECSDLFRLTSSSGKPRSKVWEKGQAAQNEIFYNAASDQRLLDLIKPILGANIILWGARTVLKKAGEVHAFHSDIEACSPTGQFVSIWIGLNNTGSKAGLKFVKGSHRFGKPVQQVENEKGLFNVGDDTIMEWAKEFSSDSELCQPEVQDGSALIFDGRVWHGSHNTGTGPRTALLFQYASQDQPVFIPKDFDAWPPVFQTGKRPPVVAVLGAPISTPNDVVHPPKARQFAPLCNQFYELDVPPAAPNPFQSISHFKGATPVSAFIESHTSVLAPQACPHPLHWHDEEELLVVISGEASLHIADDAQGSNLRIELLLPGDFIYYPSFLHHTIKNPGSSPLEYTMFKWRNNAPKTNFDRSPRELIFRNGNELATVQTSKRINRKLFEIQTHWLQKLHSHLSVLAPTIGYQAHADEHDVAIVLVSGSVHTLGTTITGPAVLFHPAGELHGLQSVGRQAARYVVFEFHGQATSFPTTSSNIRNAKDAIGRHRDRRCKDLLRPFLRLFGF
jgi:mannose-6-phosphate isomerase-like protein (cupin superfamily)